MNKTISTVVGMLVFIPWLGQAQPGSDFPLKVGAARVEVTPENFPIAPATGIYDHERLYARAIVLDNSVTRAALISLDARIESSMWTDVYKQLADELQCPVDNIIVATSHTHSNNRILNPGSSYSYGTSVPASSPEEIQVVARGILEAVRQARARLQPALMGFGTGMSYLNVNRDAIDGETRQWTQSANLDGWSDKSVDVIKFETPEGKPIAVFMNYAIHPIDGYVLGIFSADIPGAVSRYVEKAFDDKIVVGFSQGAEGDQNPLYLRPSTNAMASRQDAKITGYELNREEVEGPLRVAERADPVDPVILDDLFRFIESEGQILGEEVIRVMTVTDRMTGSVAIAGQQKVLTCPGRKRVDGGDYLNPDSRSGMEGIYEDAADVKIKIGVLGLGTSAIVRVNGEIFSYIGLRMKKESPLTNTMVVALANPGETGPGYIPNDAAYGEQTMQVLRTALKSGCAEETIVNATIDMVTEYLDK